MIFSHTDYVYNSEMCRKTETYHSGFYIHLKTNKSSCIRLWTQHLHVLAGTMVEPNI